jgi:hypothetical protein
MTRICSGEAKADLGGLAGATTDIDAAVRTSTKHCTPFNWERVNSLASHASLKSKAWEMAGAIVRCFAGFRDCEEGFPALLLRGRSRQHVSRLVARPHRLPFALRLTLASAAGMDRSVEQAALFLDGSEATVLRRAILPLLLPGLMSGWALALIQGFDDVTMTVCIAAPGTEVGPRWDRGVSGAHVPLYLGQCRCIGGFGIRRGHRRRRCC